MTTIMVMITHKKAPKIKGTFETLPPFFPCGISGCLDLSFTSFNVLGGYSSFVLLELHDDC